MSDNFFDNESFINENQQIEQQLQQQSQLNNNNNNNNNNNANQNSGDNNNHDHNSNINLAGTESMNTDDADLFDIKQRVKGMDEEAARLIQLQNEMEQQMKSTASPTASMVSGVAGSVGGGPFGGFMSAEEKLEADSRSIYVGNVDYSATAQELEAHFHGCGSINRVTILCDKFSGHPKGFAYVEFGDKDSVQTAMALDESLFKGRQIKVVSKRTNKPGISSTDRAPRGRGGVIYPSAFGFMGRGGRAAAAAAAAAAAGFGAPRGAYNPYMRSYRGRIVKGGRGGGFAPYYAPY